MRCVGPLPLALGTVLSVALAAAAGARTSTCCAPDAAPRSAGSGPEACADSAILPEGDGLRAIRGRLRDAVASDSAVSISIAVVAGEDVVWSEAFGLADRDRGVEATPGTPYAIASVTKPVTATAVMKLVERGDLELGRPVNGDLGESGLHGPDGWAERVTVRHLLQHRGGLPTHFHFVYADEAFERPPMDTSIRRYGIVVQPPGRRSVYSNFGYGVLERLIERVDGRDYATFLREEIFGPLGMSGATVGPPEGAAALPAGCRPAARYAYTGAPVPRYDFDHRGASAVVATAGAMARFGASHFDRPPASVNPVLAGDTRRAMRTDTVTDPDGDSRGLGWRVRRHASGATVVEHSGGMPGTLSMLRVVPGARVSVFAVSNSASSPLPALVSAAVLDTLLEEAGGGQEEREESGSPPRAAAPTPHPAPSPMVRDDGADGDPDAAPAGRLVPLSGRWCGVLDTWTGRHPIELRVAAPEDSARVRWPGGTEPLEVTGFRVTPAGGVTGAIDARIETPDAARAPHYVRFELFVTEDSLLSGAAIAMSVPPASVRARFGLPSRVILRRECP